MATADLTRLCALAELLTLPDPPDLRGRATAGHPAGAPRGHTPMVRSTAPEAEDPEVLLRWCQAVYIAQRRHAYAVVSRGARKVLTTRQRKVIWYPWPRAAAQ